MFASWVVVLIASSNATGSSLTPCDFRSDVTKPPVAAWCRFGETSLTVYDQEGNLLYYDEFVMEDGQRRITQYFHFGTKQDE